ncbi:hypothetical protein ACHAWX_004088 [Stephanocyclus meneghinianus]
MKAFCLFFTSLIAIPSIAWQWPTLRRTLSHVPIDDSPFSCLPPSPQRRTFLLLTTSSLATVSPLANPNANAATSTPDLSYATTPTGLQYADVKLGTGPPPTVGSTVSIDYVMSTTGARYGSKIYSTVDAGAPYRWKLGDGSTIPGLEEAVSTMSPGGIRRVIIPAKLAYQANSSGVASLATIEECQEGKGLGPRPPAAEAVGEFQRFKNIYCNPDRQYQPDLVMDVKLYGKRN